MAIIKISELYSIDCRDNNYVPQTWKRKEEHGLHWSSAYNWKFNPIRGRVPKCYDPYNKA